MALQRVYFDWEGVKDATGTPGSRKRKVWREYLQTRPAIAYWGDSWSTTPLYRNLNWHSFTRIEGISSGSASRASSPRTCARAA